MAESKNNMLLTRPSRNGSYKASGYSRITAATAAVGEPVVGNLAPRKDWNFERAPAKKKHGHPWPKRQFNLKN